ncbi:hypothetical protein [Tritonibacter mobilis]|uniref:hypothetical protein n=1 Tax=Tritonibacter mobilis TaxID=379347 RepID=UPI000E0D9341|nr:hypothetical protein [Tritonibacter mobilis]
MDTSIGEGYLQVATALVDEDTAQVPPSAYDLRRAISTTYYALFHALAKAFADAVIGPNQPEGSGSRNAWLEVYRALDHNKCKEACNSVNTRFASNVRGLCADTVQLYQRRLRADYDPLYSPDLTEANECLGIAEARIEQLKASEGKDLRALAVWVLVHAHGTKAVRLANKPRERPDEQ